MELEVDVRQPNSVLLKSHPVRILPPPPTTTPGCRFYSPTAFLFLTLFHIFAFVPEDSKYPQSLCIRCSLPETLPPVTYPVRVPTLFRLIPKYHLCQDSFHDQCMWNNPYSIILFSFLQRSFINSYIICLFVFYMTSSHCNISSTGQQCGPFYSLLYLELCLQCHNLSINVY